MDVTALKPLSAFTGEVAAAINIAQFPGEEETTS